MAHGGLVARRAGRGMGRGRIAENPGVQYASRRVRSGRIGTVYAGKSRVRRPCMHARPPPKVDHEPDPRVPRRLAAMSSSPPAKRTSVLATRPCWGCGRTCPPGETFGACPRCIEEKLVACTFCTVECLNAHWPRHKKWHRAQRKLAKRLQETSPKAEP